MKRLLFTIATATALGANALAQETYDNAPIATKDLNGTARYVGMGGAMEALGADISTMGTNPAGIGLFRKKAVSVSFGVNSVTDAQDFYGMKKTKMSFDHAGFVYTVRESDDVFVNFGFSYTKSKDFNQIVNASGALRGASQNKLTGMKNYNGIYTLRQKGNTLVSQDAACSQLDYLYINTILADSHAALTDENGNLIGENTDGYLVRPTTDINGNTTFAPAFYNADGYRFGRGNEGYIGEYNFNLSGNVHNWLYWGVTAGVYDVHYNSVTSYTENIVDGNNNGIGNVTLTDNKKITGSGFDIKAGVIIRPVADSPFRFGAYIHTPTWYDLTTSNYTRLDNGLERQYGAHDYGEISEAYDFKFYTPWRFGLSLGHVIDNCIAIGATYEYADYTSCDIRVNDGGTVDWWGNYYDESHSDRLMKENIRQSLDGVHTLKLGMEYKPASNVSLRLGYNYVSPMYKSNGFKNGTLNSYGSYYSSTTDYTNWKATNRLTAGVGYAWKKFSADLACVYSSTKGDFYPFLNYVDDADPSYDNVCEGIKVKDKHSKLILTLGYRF